MKIGSAAEQLAALVGQAQPSASGQGKATAVQAAEPVAPRSSQAGPAGAGTGESTTVKLSEAAVALQQAEAAGGGSFDVSKVEAVRRAIASGTFSVNAYVVAEKLLANARDALVGDPGQTG